MLVIQGVRRLAADVARLPALTRFGLVLMVTAGVLDLVLHLAVGPAAGVHRHHVGADHGAHVLGIAGMALVLAGIVAIGARRSLRHTGGTRDAHR